MSGRALLCLSLLAVVVGCGGEAGQSAASGGGGSGTPGGADKSGLLPFRLALNWYPEVEHGGFIAADVQGKFAAEGVSAEIIPGGPGAPQAVIAELAAGRIQFAVSDADTVVLARAAGVPVVALLAPLQSSPRCIMVHRAAGFKTLADLRDIELAISDARPFALWMKKQLPLTNVRLIPFSGMVGEFLQKPAFAQQAFVFSEPFVAKERGGDPEVLMVSEIGFDPYASVLITTEDVIAENSELVQKVVRASVAGWREYLQAPAVTNEAIGKLNSEMSAAALEFGAAAMTPLCRAAGGEAGGEAGGCGMELGRWEKLVEQIEELGQIEKGSVRASECFTVKFLGAG
ncbi:MAG: ABC transporter substrate-binding protein [Planctomycetaceae bacterium]